MKRASGVLLNISSLDTNYGVGDLGPSAYRFVDFLSRSGQQYWQTLPLNPPTSDQPHCPYSAVSAFAGDPMFISPKLLYRDGLIDKTDIDCTLDFPADKIDYRKVKVFKHRLFSKAYRNFKSSVKKGFDEFRIQNSDWLYDFAIFSAFKDHFKTGFWNIWPSDIQNRQKQPLSDLSSRHADSIDYYMFLQFIFFKQFYALKKYCISKHVRLIGDIPIYVAFDSADVWANRNYFKLNRNNKPTHFTGTPPDDYCKDGQVWGNPVYNWKELKKTHFSWWMQRIGHNLNMFDIVRIDHFRGLIAYWQVPAANKTSKKGTWVRAPKDTFFAEMFARFSTDSIIVEDLGVITPAVARFVKQRSLSGMRIIQWGLGSKDPKNIHRQKNHITHSVVYTGTHDNNTIKGWFEDEIDQPRRIKVLKEVGANISADDIHWRIIEHTMRSKSFLSIIQMQDILGLDSRARMNIPGTIEGNWQWKMKPRQITAEITRRLKTITKKSERLNCSNIDS